MSFQRGDILLADLPFSDRTGSKKRPVLVVSNDVNNAAIDDLILAAISSITRPGAFTHVFVDPSDSEGSSSGLLHPSYVQCENLFTLDQTLILRKLGHLTPSLQQKVNDALRAALELP
jgi:mRNA interferase MazF